MLRVLYIEDQEADATLVKALIGNLVKLTWVTDVPTRESADDYPADDYDVILLDLRLPGSEGVETVNLASERFPNTPIVVLSQTVDDLDNSVIVSGIYSIHDKRSMDPMDLVSSIRRAAVITEARAANSEEIKRHLIEVNARIDRLVAKLQKAAEESGHNVPTRKE